MSKPAFFHHPDLSLPVLRRRSAEFLFDMLAFYGTAMLTRGRSLTWESCYPSRTAYRAAVRRLYRRGFLVDRHGPGGRRTLELDPQRPLGRPELVNPERFWKRAWPGVWYVLVYDIQESDRRFRDGLRRFLYSLRLGCLQKSVWVSAYDIRPHYDDLQQAFGMKSDAFLFEARTVLGRSPAEVVRTAWPLDKVEVAQVAYLRMNAENRALLRNGGVRPNEIGRLAREEMDAYAAAMEKDPLLPAELLPSSYQGRAVAEAHRLFVREVRSAAHGFPASAD